MIEISEKSICCGCSACMNICPKGAIQMREDSEGFLYPHVDKEKCIECGLCNKVCPAINENKKEKVKKAYVVQHKNEDKLRKSTSGAAFLAIAEYILSNNGIVAGAMFDDLFVLRHSMIETVDNIEKMQGSKYIQSNLGNIYSKIKEKLEANKMVLFIGTPCQISGLKSFLQKDFDNLLTIDLVCRSVPSPKMWKRYLTYLENKYKSKVNYVKFRDKTYGYHSSTLTIKFENNKIYRGSNRICLFGQLFHGDKISRPSCYECKYKGVERCSDFTLFDSWNSEKLNSQAIDNNKGYTNVFIHTEKGLKLFEKIKENISFYEIDVLDAIKYTGGMVEKSILKPKERNEIYIDLEQMSFEKFSKKYSISTVKDYFFEYSKKILYKTGILIKLQKIKKRNKE